MVPKFDAEGNLPPGVHWVIWPDLVAAFGTTPHRRRLLDGLYRVAANLRTAGCATLYLDGSFVTTKTTPKDFDACWEVAGVDTSKLDPVLFDFKNGRLAQKLKFGGELFPSSFVAEATSPWRTFLAFFQEDKNGNAKGIIALDLTRLA